MLNSKSEKCNKSKFENVKTLAAEWMKLKKICEFEESSFWKCYQDSFSGKRKKNKNKILRVMFPCCSQRPCRCLRSMLPPATMRKFMGHAWHRLLWVRKLLLQCYQWLQTHSWEWETLKALAITPPPFSGKKQSRQAAIESFKTVIKRWKCSSSQLVASVGEGEGLSYL